MHTNLLLAIVLAPVIGSFLLPVAGRISERLRNGLALLLVLIPLIGSILIIPIVMAGQKITILWGIPLGLDFILTADRLAVFMALVSSLISAIIIIYSFDYISHYDNQNEYYLMVVLFLGSIKPRSTSESSIFQYLTNG